MAVGINNSSSTILNSIEGKLKLLEESRLRSFDEWKFDQNEKCSASEMAKAGFYFIGNMDVDDDSATCFVCGKTLDGWENTDDPWIEHRKHSANCKFLQMGRCEEDLTVEEWIDICKHVIKAFLTKKHLQMEADFKKAADKARNIIQSQQY